MVVCNGRGRAGGIHKQRPSPHNACKSVKRARTFCAQHKSLAACADLLPLARLFWAKSMFTPLPQFPRPSRTPCKLLPAAAGVKFRCGPAHPGWVGRTALYHPVIAAAQQTFYHPSPQAGVPLGGENSGRGEVGQKRSKRETAPAERRQKKAGLAEAVRKRSRTGGERKNEREIVGKKPERLRTVMVPGKGQFCTGGERRTDGWSLSRKRTSCWAEQGEIC